MAVPARELEQLLVHLTPAELAWLRDFAARRRVSEAAVVEGLVRSARARDARREDAWNDLFRYLGGPAELDADEEAAILREITGDG